MSNLIRFNAPPEPPKECSFCRATGARLFSNNMDAPALRFICGNCVTKCAKLIDKENQNETTNS